MLTSRHSFLTTTYRLRKHYVLGTSGSTPKAELFDEYLNMCSREGVEPTSNSAFGKLVRMYASPIPRPSSPRCSPMNILWRSLQNDLRAWVAELVRNFADRVIIVPFPVSAEPSPASSRAERARVERPSISTSSSSAEKQENKTKNRRRRRAKLAMYRMTPTMRSNWRPNRSTSGPARAG